MLTRLWPASRDILPRTPTMCVLIQTRTYYNPNDGVLPRRESRRTLAKTRRTLSKETSSDSRIVLLPPYVSPGEMRILLGIDYKSALSMCNVKAYHQKFYWSDLEGRLFESANKRKILVPFEVVAPGVSLFGLTPILIDPEPPLSTYRDSPRIPVVSVFGQRSPAIYGDTLINPHPSTSTGPFDLSRITVLPITPTTSRVVAGRSLAHSDAIIVVGEASTSLLDSLPSEFTEGKPILSVLDEGEIFSALSTAAFAADAAPHSPAASSAAAKYAKETKRTDILVGAEKCPSVSGVVLTVSKSAQEGTTALVLIQRGQLRRGLSFVSGSGFGKVVNMWSPSGRSVESAVAGEIVKVGKLVKDGDFRGNFSPDDSFFVFSKERAWRLAFHRQRIEGLAAMQTDGAKMKVVGFEMDQPEDSGGEERWERIEDVVRKGAAVTGDVDLSLLGRKREELMKMRREGRAGSILIEPEAGLEMRAEKESKKVVERWNARIAEYSAVDDVRRLAHDMARRDDGEDVTKSVGDQLELPESKPVIPIIVKTRSVSQFDSLLDALEQLEWRRGVKIPIVHGGIGPVTPTDIVHAEIEGKLSPQCPVYCVGDVEVLPQCSGAVEVVRFETSDEMVREIERRVDEAMARSGRNRRVAGLNRRSQRMRG